MQINRLKGKLKRWNPAKGFGFISTNDEKKDIFIHISALKEMSRRPVVGDIIYYEIHIDNDGKSRAVNASIEGASHIKSTKQRKTIKTSKKNKWFSQILFLIFLIIISSIFYKKYFESYLAISSQEKEEYKEDFSCSGKIFCSEMTSCEEAKFYQRNCSGTKMDGDGDGIPCESQWCN